MIHIKLHYPVCSIIMKKIILALLVLAGIETIVNAQDSLPSRIVFIREYNFQGSALSYGIVVNEMVVTRLKNESYFEYNCFPGNYELSVVKQSGPKLKLQVEPGRSYYILFHLRTGPWTVYPELIQADSAFASNLLKNGTYRKQEVILKPLEMPKNHFGVVIEMGTGIDQIPVVTMENGDDANISFGGGIGIGLQYGREVNRHFDISGNLNYMTSSLTPPINNGDVSFSRGRLDLTLAYIFPIKGGENMRIKLGAGPDFIFQPVLNIDLAKIQGGITERWNYYDTGGYHLSLTYEMNSNEKWAFVFGLKWTDCIYKYASGSKDYPNKQFENPAGSAIDFIMGIDYHF